MEKMEMLFFKREKVMEKNTIFKSQLHIYN